MDFLDNVSLPNKIESEVMRYGFKDAGAIRRSLRAAKARVYIDENLKCTASSSGSCGSCCSQGTLTYVRNDGGSITDDDVAALLMIDRGQENRASKRSPDEVTIFWLCDSSD